MEKKNSTVTANRQNVADKSIFNQAVQAWEKKCAEAAAAALYDAYSRTTIPQIAEYLSPWGITAAQVASSLEETINKGFIVTQNDRQRSETEIESRWTKKEIWIDCGNDKDGYTIRGFSCSPKELLTGIRVGVKYAAAVKRLREDPEAAARAKAAREMREKLARIDELTAQMLAAATAGDMATVATVAAQIQALKK